MEIDPLRLSGVMVFLSVANHRSFRQAALELGLSPAAVSKTIRQFEQRHGVALFQRTTRSVVLTEAGQALYQCLRPATAVIDDALTALDRYQDHPRGVLRLTLSHSAMQAFAEPVVEAFHQLYPQVALDLSVNDGFVDLASGGFDAGIRLGEAIAQDMVAVRLSPGVTWAVMGSPGYFAHYGYPEKPEDLTSHQAIHYRFVGSGQIHTWEFQRDGQPLRVEMKGQLTVNARDALLGLARRGLGLAYLSDMEAAPDLASGKLEAVLRGYIPTDSGFFLYFPVRMQTQPKLKAFIEVATRGLRLQNA
ncbi:MAG TPA: LysR substrate-binding domain-containing protein [Burkholderiaceae bacterium]